MPDIHIRREHLLGLEGARNVARQWREKAQHRFGMSVQREQGDAGDTVNFEAAGVRGRLVLAADHLEIEAHLGFMLAPFAPRIRSEIERELDALLSAAQAQADAASPAAAAAEHATPKSRQTGQSG